MKLIGTNDFSFDRASLEPSLAIEYADLGSLEAYIDTKPEWEIKFNIIKDIATGLTALHLCDILHNHVKCSNVLIFSKPRVTAKISDGGDLSGKGNDGITPLHVAAQFI